MLPVVIFSIMSDTRPILRLQSCLHMQMASQQALCWWNSASVGQQKRCQKEECRPASKLLPYLTPIHSCLLDMMATSRRHIFFACGALMLAETGGKCEPRVSMSAVSECCFDNDCDFRPSQLVNNKTTHAHITLAFGCAVVARRYATSGFPSRARELRRY
jgi:hypothetical protein